MTTSSEEELMAQLLSEWLDDLRHDREPRKSTLAEQFPSERAADVMELARWYKSILYPSSGSTSSVDTIASNVGERVLQARRAEASAVADIVESATSFDELLRHAAAHLDVDLANLERACGLRRMELLRAAAGTQPAHRVPVEAMLRVFRGLRLPNAAVDVLRRSSLEWGRSSRTGSQVRLNLARNAFPEPRIDDEETTGEGVEAYCNTLHERLK